MRDLPVCRPAKGFCVAQVFQLAAGQPCLCPSCDLCALTSSQVSRRRQVRKVIQADDVDDGADHARMVLHRERERERGGTGVTVETEQRRRGTT